MEPVGEDLSAVLTGGAKPPSLTAFSHTMLRLQSHDYTGTLYNRLVPDGKPERMQVSLREQDMVFMIAKTDAGRPEAFQPVAYNLAVDPLGTDNVFDEANSRHQNMIKRLRECKVSLVSACKLWSGVENSLEDVDAKLEALRQMGYIQ